MHLLDGKKLAAEIRAKLASDIQRSKITPGLGVLLVGDDPASQTYVTLKGRAAEDVGINFLLERQSADASDEVLLSIVERWNRDPQVHAILIQLPLPPGHDTDKLIQTIDPRKDVDGFHPVNRTALLEGKSDLISPTHEAILRLIGLAPVTLNDATIALLAKSETFAQPLEHLLTTAGAHVKIMQPDELDHAWLKAADIVIAALGRPRFVTPTLVKDDAVIIDVGISKTADGKIVGDVDQEAFTNTDVWLTPVPGGVGPMTVAVLLEHVFELAERNPSVLLDISPS